MVLALPLVLWVFISPSSDWVERRYSRGFYAWLSSWLVPLSNAVPFSMSTVLLFVVPLVWVLVLVVTFKRRLVWRWLALSLWRTLVLGLLVGSLFLFTWGANYDRQSIETQFSLGNPVIVQADLETLVTDLDALIHETVASPRDEDAAMRSIVESLEGVVERRTGVTPRLPARVKRLPKGSLILSGNAAGVISPWTLEPHVDGALPSVSYLAVGAHELAHVAGYAGEADADFMGYMAGLRASNDYARYATALRLWQDAVWQLPEAVRESARAQLPDQAKTDLESMLEPYRTYQMPAFVQNAQRAFYDSYLKTQGVASGIQDYSRTVDLIIAAQKQGLLFDF